jgi:hypothetical protein
LSPQNARRQRGILVGFLVARHISEEWELENIVVAPEVRAGGFGQKLLMPCSRMCGKRGAARSFLRSGNRTPPRERSITGRDFTKPVGARAITSVRGRTRFCIAWTSDRFWLATVGGVSTRPKKMVLMLRLHQFFGIAPELWLCYRLLINPGLEVCLDADFERRTPDQS